MGGCRCTYRDCKNTTKTSENLHFFHYPVKHKERCKAWIRNAEKPHFCNLEEEQLRNKVICELHFETRFFPNLQKKRLLHSAIPTLDASESEAEMATFNDVQIHPASEDGTIFHLDTNFTFKPFPQVESYIYKNGSIVPIASKQISSSNVSEEDSFFASKHHHEFLGENKYKKSLFIDDPDQEFDNLKFTEVDSPKENVLNDNLMNLFTPSSDLGTKLSRRQDADSSPEEVSGHKQETIPPEPESSKKNPSQQHGSKGVTTKTTLIERNYLRKIKQHSREIATIKRMLKSKHKRKSENPSLSDQLRNQLPASLFAIVQLHLNASCNLSSSDLDFFLEFYNWSPNIYNELRTKYNWVMPTEDMLQSCNQQIESQPPNEEETVQEVICQNDDQ